MWKGPISHAGLGSDLLALGAGPDVSCPVWTQKMKNDSATVVLIATRVVSDYEELPPAMRKSAGPEMVAQLQRVCRCMVLAKTSLMQILSTEIFSAEWPGLMEKFMLKCMDHTLSQVSEICPEPWDLENIVEFKAILSKIADKREELRSPSNAAVPEMHTYVCACLHTCKLMCAHDWSESMQGWWRFQLTPMPRN